jgi:hypothetical protein
MDHFLPGYSKKGVRETLDYFDVNRVEIYSLLEWINKWNVEGSLSLSSLWNLRSYDPIGYFIHNLSPQQIDQMLYYGVVDNKSHYVVKSMKREDDENLICNGEAMLYIDEYKTYNWCGWTNKTKGLNLRDAMKKGTLLYIYNRYQVPKPIFNLIWSKKLINSVVEFSIYDTPVGIKNQDILIWEIRKY